jgi:formylglycine-generating enzyme required for sulfatase activity
MKTFFRLLALLSLFALCSLAEAQLAVGNIRPVQRSSSKMGDIDYDVTGTTSLVTVALQISADGGSTWAVPATALTGAIGGNVTPASNLRITWDSGADWNQQLSSQMKFRISVANGVVPTGFALIPAGSFTMGDALDGLSDVPAHTVTVSAFCMAKNLVTKADWDIVRTWATSNGYNDLAAGSGKASTHPVQTISWYQMIKYCNARSEKEGLTPVYYTNDAKTAAYIYKEGSVNVTDKQVKWTANGYRLPTEAEWEKAARGGLSGKRFPWGDTISQTQANYYGSTSSYSYDLGPNGYNSIGSVGGTSPATSPVGSFAANGYGLNDMAGNLWQWCWDWYGTYDMASPTNPRGGATGTYRVFRGGRWNVEANRCRVAYRDSSDPASNFNGIGFRVARSLSLNSEMGDSANVTWDARDEVNIASQPTNVTANQGASASFSVTAAGGGPYSYQWKKNGSSISNATGATLNLSNVQAADADSYSVVVTGLGSVTSSAAVLTVNVPPTVVTPPANVSANAGSSASFSVTAAGSTPATYQWKKNGVAIAGATSATLSLSAVGIVEEGIYTCVVANAYGTVESVGGRLTVTVLTSSPDTDGDKVSDSLEDYLAGLGFDPATGSADALARLKAIVPLLGDFYTSDQMRGLALGQAVLEPQAGGKFRLSLELEESADLSTWTSKAVSAEDVTITSGKLGVDIQPASVKTKFYRLQGKP